MSTLLEVAVGVSVVADVAGLGGIVWWIASRKRIAADTVGRAQEHAGHIRQQAEREAESLKKEAQLEAREKTHTLVAEAEQRARARQQEIAGLDQALADRTRALADRIAATETQERELRSRAAALADLQMRTEAAAGKAEQALADGQRD